MTEKTMTRVRVPINAEFEEHGTDFLPAPDVQNLAFELIERYPEFEHLQTADLGFAWKQKGGESNGKPTFGKCQKPSGLLKFFSKRTFVVWLAADNCREYGLGPEQIEALVYHELSHAGEEEDKQGNPKPVIVAHDIETFGLEVGRYGLWTDDLRRIKPVFDQAELPGFMQS